MSPESDEPVLEKDYLSTHSGLYMKVTSAGNSSFLQLSPDGTLTEHWVFGDDDQWSGTWFVHRDSDSEHMEMLIGAYHASLVPSEPGWVGPERSSGADWTPLVRICRVSRMVSASEMRSAG